MKKGDRIRKYILWYTQFFDTSTIYEYDLCNEINEKFKTSYQLNRFRQFYLDKMQEYFEKYKGDNGYFIYERKDIHPDPDWTLSYALEFEKRPEDQKEYSENEDFYIYLDYAKKHNDLEFENYILKERVKELEDKTRVTS